MKPTVLALLLSLAALKTPVHSQAALNQEEIGAFSCGPCAIVNSLRFATDDRWKAALEGLKGATPKEKVEDLIKRYGSKPSVSYAPPKTLYGADRGSSPLDIVTCMNALFDDHDLPRLEGTFLDIAAEESGSQHLRRVHEGMKRTLDSGLPVLLSLRSFGTTFDEVNGRFIWEGLFGHFVTIIEVQDALETTEKGFRFVYIDSDESEGQRQHGYLHVEQNRAFWAKKGDAERWEGLNGFPFLMVTAPSLAMGLPHSSWHTRTYVMANYAAFVPHSTEENGGASGEDR
ncbi:MAG: hypothetical protein KDB53_10550 [Planctomycetes bacterium]|nr:hypothetical protein [Planctomycetota bacterium]